MSSVPQLDGDGDAAATAAAAATATAPPGILQLPAEVELLIFSFLPAASLAACLATCRTWRDAPAASDDGLWRALHHRRWRHGPPQLQHPPPQQQQQQQQQHWREAYGRRRQLDAEALALLRRLQWPDHHWAALQGLRDLGFESIRDLLHFLSHPPSTDDAAASTLATTPRERRVADWPDAEAELAAAPCGVPYWATAAYRELSAQHWAGQVRALSAAVAAAAAADAGGQQGVAAAAEAGVEAAAGEAGGDGGGAALAAAAEAAMAEVVQGWHEDGVEADEGARVQRPSQSAAPGGTAAPVASSLSLRPSPLEASFELGALALSHVHYPFADRAWVLRSLDVLGRELRRRMEAAGVGGGSLEGLRLLGQLLFGEGPPPRHPHFASIPPPDGYGMEIMGNREQYYTADNSLLNSVLSSREGIPISLAVLHAAVGTRAGLRVELLNVPMHVCCAMTDADTQQRWYVDVFDGGRLMDSDTFQRFLGGLGVPAPFVLDAQAMTPQQCWVRMSRNLLHIHSEQRELRLFKHVALVMAAAAGPNSVEEARAVAEAAHACMSLQEYRQALELLRGVHGGPFQLHAGALPGTHPLAPEGVLLEVWQIAEDYEAALMRVHRRDSGGAPGGSSGSSSSGGEGTSASASAGSSRRVRFHVGSVMRHRRYAYRGVITGWDPRCSASEEWMKQMGVDRLPGGRGQPFYHVLPDQDDRPGQTYVAQENIELDTLPELLLRGDAGAGYSMHPEVGRFFDAVAPGGASYRPNAWLRHCYPDDLQPA